jgi:glucosylglycerate phosphorylase
VNAAHRLELLDGLYGREASVIEARAVERLGAEPAGSTPGITERDAWLICYPDQFRTAGEAPLRTLGALIDRHLSPEINGVHVLPFHPSSSDRGFSVVDYSEVDPAFGTWRDVAELAAGRRLMADAVVNHTSANGTWFRGFLAGDPRFAGFFRTADPYADLSAVVRPRTSPLLTTFQSATGPISVWTTFSADQVDLDYRNPEVLLAVLDVLLRYRRAGASAIRLDAIAFIWKVEDSPSINLPGTHDVIELLRSWLDELDPGLLLVTETNVPHAENVSYLGRPGRREAQAVYQFALPPLLLHTLATGDAEVLVDWASALGELPPGRTYLNFTSSHDGVGLRPLEGLLEPTAVAALTSLCERAGGVVNRRRRADGSDVPYELASTWYSLMTAIDADPEQALARHLLSQAFVLALSGIPLLYTHVLFASDNDVDRYARTGVGRDLNRADFEPVAALDAALADPTSRPARSLAALKRMLGLRRGAAAFDPQATQHVSRSGQVVTVRRTASSGEVATVHLNVGTTDAITHDGVRIPALDSVWRLEPPGSTA